MVVVVGLILSTISLIYSLTLHCISYLMLTMPVGVMGPFILLLLYLYFFTLFQNLIYSKFCILCRRCLLIFRFLFLFTSRLLHSLILILFHYPPSLTLTLTLTLKEQLFNFTIMKNFLPLKFIDFTSATSKCFKRKGFSKDRLEALTTILYLYNIR